MNAQTLGTVLLKLLGIVWVYSSVLRALDLFLGPGGVPGLESLTTGAAIALILGFTAGVWLIKSGSAVSAYLFDASDQGSIQASPEQLFALFAGILGLYFLVSSTVAVAGLGYMALNPPDWQEQPGFESLWEAQRIQLLSNVIQFALGAALLLGRGGLSRLWDRIHPMSPMDSMNSSN